MHQGGYRSVYMAKECAVRETSISYCPIPSASIVAPGPLGAALQTAARSSKQQARFGSIFTSDPQEYRGGLLPYEDRFASY